MAKFNTDNNRLPVEFTARHEASGQIYSASKSQDNSYSVKWDNINTCISEEMVCDFVNNGLWTIIPPTEIKAGDWVEVIDEGKTYTMYKEWAAKHDLKNWRQGWTPSNGAKLEVVKVANHNAKNTTVLLGVQDPLNKWATYIIGVEGVKRVESGPEINGVDAQGNPLNLTEDMLKPFQRVMTKNGNMHIVTTNVQSDYHAKWALINKNGWNTLNIGAQEGAYEPYEAVAVYEAPDLNSQLLDFDAKGKLVWTANTEFSKQTRQKLKQKLKDAEIRLEEAKKDVASICAEMQAIE